MDKSLFRSFNLISKLNTLLCRSCQVLMKRKIHLGGRSPISPAHLTHNLHGETHRKYPAGSVHQVDLTTSCSCGVFTVPGFLPCIQTLFWEKQKTKQTIPHQHNQHQQNQISFKLYYCKRV